ncbi:MAG: hypothetical protein J0L58_15600, partial [Burkholderiales bacterium]|nr:hypothetical protein [Burkholderiales bacterium]
MQKDKKPDPNAKSAASEATAGRALSSSIKVLGVLRQSGSTYLVANSAGAPLDRAIRIPAGLLAKANAGQLERFILESELSCLLSHLDIKDISVQLRKAYTNSSSVVVASPGQHTFIVEGKEYQLLAHNGCFRWLGLAPGDTTVTLIGEAASHAKPTKSLDDFNNVLTPIVASSPRLMLVLLVALAAMLVGPLKLPPLAVLLVGRSSTG